MKRHRATSAAQILIFVGGAVILLTGILALLGIPLSFTFMEGHIMIYPVYTMSAYIGIVGVISGIAIILSAFLIGSRSGSEIQYWSASALIFAVVGLIGGGGLLIGSLLALAGSVLGLSHRQAAVLPINATRAPTPTKAQHRSDNQVQMKIMSGLKTEEKRLYELTSGSGGAIFQADLVEKSGFSKVKVSRILDKLEGRGLIERRRRGMTNMVIVKNGTAQLQPL